MIQAYFVPLTGRQLNALGTFFRYESAGLEGPDQSLKVRIDGNDAGTLLPGDAIEIPVQAGTWDLQPASCSANVKVGFGRITTVRSTVAGSVAVSVLPARPLVGTSSTAKTVTNGSAALVAANAARTYLLIQNNDGAGFISVNLTGAAATTANGIRIAPGGFWEWTGESIPTGAITAIGSIASNPNIVVVEG